MLRWHWHAKPSEWQIKEFVRSIQWTIMDYRSINGPSVHSLVSMKLAENCVKTGKLTWSITNLKLNLLSCIDNFCNLHWSADCDLINSQSVMLMSYKLTKVRHDTVTFGRPVPITEIIYTIKEDCFSPIILLFAWHNIDILFL